MKTSLSGLVMTTTLSGLVIRLWGVDVLPVDQRIEPARARLVDRDHPVIVGFVAHAVPPALDRSET